MTVTPLPPPSSSPPNTETLRKCSITHTFDLLLCILWWPDSNDYVFRKYSGHHFLLYIYCYLHVAPWFRCHPIVFWYHAQCTTRSNYFILLFVFFAFYHHMGWKWRNSVDVELKIHQNLRDTHTRFVCLKWTAFKSSKYFCVIWNVALQCSMEKKNTEHSFLTLTVLRLFFFFYAFGNSM